jgi:ABC-type transport system involved in multi-copper enzyme maturation permease subunit
MHRVGPPSVAVVAVFDSRRIVWNNPRIQPSAVRSHGAVSPQERDVGLRLGSGPVFAYEWLTSSRRWQTYALRAAFVAAILVGLLLVQRDDPSLPNGGSLVSLRDLAAIGKQTYGMIVGIELTLILLVAPAATAGAVCLDKARGTLDHILVTDLSNAEIVLGKLGVRLIPVLGLVACTLPVLALSSLLGGIDPLALGGSFLVAVGCTLVGCSLAMMLSVYGRKTHEVLILTYLLIIFWLVAWLLVEVVHGMLATPLPRAAGLSLWAALHDWAQWSNPYYLAFAPYFNPGRVGVADYPKFLAVCLACSAAQVGLATARIRRVALKQAGRAAGGVRRWLPRPRRPRWWPGLPGPSLDPNPVAWREWRRTRPSWMMRAAWGLYAAFGLLWVYLAAHPRASGPTNGIIGIMNMFQVTLGLLLLGVGASTSLVEERVRGSLDVLLSTPMSTRSILSAKWWGSFRRVLPVVFWPAAMALFLAIADGQWPLFFVLPPLVLAYGAAITSMGLAVATWVRRPGRAIAVCATAYVILVVGWPILELLWLSEGLNGPVGRWMILGDPPFGALFLTMSFDARGGIPIGAGPRFIATETTLWAILWIVAYVGAAALLFWATLATFDGCLGRIPDDGARPPSRVPGRSSLSSAQLLALVPRYPKSSRRIRKAATNDVQGG